MDVPNVKNVVNCVISGDGGNFVLALFYVAPSITVFVMSMVEWLMNTESKMLWRDILVTWYLYHGICL